MISLFIYSNSGGNVIAEVALDFWRRGKLREELWMNSKELEIQISQNIFNDENSVYWKNIDLYIQNNTFYLLIFPHILFAHFIYNFKNWLFPKLLDLILAKPEYVVAFTPQIIFFLMFMSVLQVDFCTLVS